MADWVSINGRQDGATPGQLTMEPDARSRKKKKVWAGTLSRLVPGSGGDRSADQSVQDETGPLAPEDR